MMRSARILIEAEVWDTRNRYVLGKVATVAVNWGAFGPVTPRVARSMARSILRCANEVERRTKKLRSEGWKVRNSLEEQ